MELSPSEAFKIETTLKLADKQHRSNLLKSLNKYNFTNDNPALQYQDHELAQRRSAHVKWKSLENLDSYLIEFEANFIKNGGKVIWAQNENEAIKEIIALIKRSNGKTVMKTKSATFEEIELSKALHQHDISFINTAVGEYLQQLCEESTEHSNISFNNRTKEQIGLILKDRLTLSDNFSLAELIENAKNQLHKSNFEVEVSITGANFLIADIGGIALSECQGNSNLEIARSKLHIVIAGIEKIIPGIQDLDLLWPLHATHTIGERAWVYNSVVTGPKINEENDGPEEMYVILLDNGRSNLLEKEELRKSLSCIQCGACLKACPIYQNIGGPAYGSGIGGPIGSIITPNLKNLREYKHLTYASTLCGNCTDVCPVKIDLHKLFTINRSEVVKENKIGSTEKGIYFFWKKGMLDREKMNKGGASFKNFLLSNFFKKHWGIKRKFPKIAQKSFNEMWREAHP